SRSVTVSDPSISPEIEIADIGYSQPEAGDGICFVDVSLCGKLETGAQYVISGTVFDAAGNSLTFSQQFLGFNESLPEIEITEIHSMYAKGTSAGQDVYKNEFIELHIMADGNLSGLELFSAYDGESKLYSLPAVEVKKDEVVVVHLRTKGDGCVNEVGDNLALATAKYSNDAVRDLWSENEDARLGDKMDVILLRNNDGRLLDSVLYACEADTEWKNAAMQAAAESAVDAGLWGPDASVSSAARADGMTASKSLVKAAGKAHAEAWSVTATNKETPGAL
ncbi:MAG: hypothetical protein K2H09_09580, partial [Treponemataceae bacterium]|nr:hypothetical protein [Treponemataceae bacterium]